ncbi:DUF6190 family protein [Streptomyces sp. NPDC051162]|uniref:DUF6190 family protein n=1 Tax=unclassified Streptomyces TaxID=2593676 RepID=UPI00341F8135
MPGEPRTGRPHGEAAGQGHHEHPVRATYVDAALFLGMNSADEATRIACKSFFATRLHGRVVMSWEQVGRCDDLVWRFPRDLQDAYYPFMDHLHTDMRIDRLGYTREDIEAGLGSDGTAGLPVHERLLAGMVLRRDGVLCTVSPGLRACRALTVHPPEAGPEVPFPEGLEKLYRASLALRIPHGLLWGEDGCSTE